MNVNNYHTLTVDETGSGAAKKDYIQEAKDYFSKKLLQYGSGTEVPIKSLLGHRSQASPQVRHISGQHIKEFTDFLAKHPDTFHVVDESVVLVNYDACAELPQTENLHLPLPSIDAPSMQKILDFFALVCETKGPTLVDELFHLVIANFSQEEWHRIFKSAIELTTFLKLFPDCFNVQSNLVTLLQKKPKVSENHIHHAEKVLYKNTMNHHQAPIIGDFKLNEPVSNNMMLNNNKSYKSESPSGNYNDDSFGNGRNSMNDLPSMGFGHSFHEVNLENLCTQNCPTKITYPQNTLVEHATSTPTQAPAPQALPKPERERERRQNLTLRERIGSLVAKTLADNDKISPSANQTLNNGSVSSSNSSSTATSPIHSRSYFLSNNWKINVLHNTRVISTIKDSHFVCDAIMKSAPSHDEHVVISFDSKGINLGVKGQLTLIEIGTVRGEAFIFDVQQCPQMMVDGGLKELLEDEHIIKIIHDCRNDSFNLYSQFNILLRSVFDTQVSSIFVYTLRLLFKLKKIILVGPCCHSVSGDW